MDRLDQFGLAGRGRRGQDAGVSMADVLELPAPLRELVTWMMRRETCSLSEISSRLGESDLDAHEVLVGLVEQGFVSRVDTDRYQARPAARSRRAMPRGVWQALDGLGDE